MQTQFILTVTSSDKPGVVEAVALVIEQQGGSWLESRLAHLGGKFAGVVTTQIPNENTALFTSALNALSSQGILVACDQIETETSPRVKTARFTAVGPDQRGIVKEISKAFAAQNINVEELETSLSSMPYSGEPLFEAEGKLSVPSNVDLQDIQEKLDNIGNELAMDIAIKEI